MAQKASASWMLADMFSNEESAIVWFDSVIWPNGRHYNYI